MSTTEQLLAVTPLDGRYSDKMSSLSPIVSEYGLIQKRVQVEIGWLTTLGSGVLPDVPELGDIAIDHLSGIAEGFSVNEAVEIKAIENETKHDVNAVIRWVTEQLTGDETFSRYLELIHFGATSEDINNLSYALMIQEARDKVTIPGIEGMRKDLGKKAEDYASMPLLSRTHGQPASPTTMGKEMRVFEERLSRSTHAIGNVVIYGKFNGATGNFNAMVAAYPDVNWQEVTSGFIKSLGLAVNPVTTQIEPHDWIARFSNEVALANTIGIDISRDIWQYISEGYFTQQVVAGEVGSSTMPHKVNPINFENAEGNFGLANALLTHLASKLPISRLQRDLSDSTALRAIGPALGHTKVAHDSLGVGLSKISPNPEKMDSALEGEWSVLTEAVQTVMRRFGIKGSYDAIKAVSRGKAIDREGYLELVNSINELPDEARATLLQLTPQKYTGYARDIAATSQ